MYVLYSIVRASDRLLNELRDSYVVVRFTRVLGTSILSVIQIWGNDCNLLRLTVSSGQDNDLQTGGRATLTGPLFQRNYFLFGRKTLQQ